MPDLDDGWFRRWVDCEEHRFLDEDEAFLKAPPRRCNWTSSAEFRMRLTRDVASNASARLALERLPLDMADWVAFTLWRVLRRAGRFHPSFEAVLRNHLYFEVLLYADTDRVMYREHIVHPYRVLAIGAHLMTELPRLVPAMSDALKQQPHVPQLLSDLQLGKDVFDDSKRQVLKTAWWLAAVFHDIGFPFLFFSRNLEPRIQQAYPVYTGGTAGRVAAATPEHLLRRALFRDLWCPRGQDAACYSSRHASSFVSENLHSNHSLIGGISLLAMLEEMESVYRVSPEQALAFHLAADAVCFHDLIGTEKLAGPPSSADLLTFENRPLAWLLALCDELQDWGRPQVRFRRSDYDTVKVKFSANAAVKCDIEPHAEGPTFGRLHTDGDTFNRLKKREETQKNGLRAYWSKRVDFVQGDRRRA